MGKLFIFISIQRNLVISIGVHAFKILCMCKRFSHVGFATGSRWICHNEQQKKSWFETDFFVNVNFRQFGCTFAVVNIPFFSRLEKLSLTWGLLLKQPFIPPSKFVYNGIYDLTLSLCYKSLFTQSQCHTTQIIQIVSYHTCSYLQHKPTLNIFD